MRFWRISQAIVDGHDDFYNPRAPVEPAYPATYIEYTQSVATPCDLHDSYVVSRAFLTTNAETAAAAAL